MESKPMDNQEILLGPSHHPAVEAIPKRRSQESERVSEHVISAGEDTILFNSEQGVYGVFDGMGGEPNADIASQLAAVCAQDIFKRKPNIHLSVVMEKARHEVAKNGKGGATTALLARLRKKGDQTLLEWANAGDCRLGLVRRGRLSWLSTEQGTGNQVDNGFGPYSPHWPRTRDELGKTPAQPGDIVFLASDGITGDWPHERLEDERIAALLSGNTADEGARRLLQASIKYDDKSLIVLHID